MIQDLDKFKNSIILLVEGLEQDSQQITFSTTNGKFIMYHIRECCEQVSVDDVSGQLNLEGALVQDLLEKTSRDTPRPDSYDSGSHTWTFYTLITNKGYTDIKWYGESNGYYSEDVDFEQLNEEI